MKKLILPLLLLIATIEVFAQASNDGKKPTTPNEFFQPLKYRNIGPHRGGRSNAACGVKGDPLTYYMGITGGGLWKTEDAGQHWNNISDGYFKTGSVGAVEVAETDPNIVYCGMGEHAVRGVMTHHGDGVYKSVDAGRTWQHMGLEKTQHIAGIVIHPKNPDVAFVAAQGALFSHTTDRGLYKTTDGGKTWRNVLYIDEKTGCADISIDKNNPLVMYAAMWEHGRLPWKVISGGPGDGLYKSVDGGETWKKLQEGLPEELGKMSVSVCQSNPDKVYALIESNSQKDLGGLFVTKNGGKSWSKVSGDNRLTQRAWYYIEVFADPQNEDMVYVLSAPCLRSRDGGRTWERISGTHGDYHHLWINENNPKNLCIANDGGAAISFNRGKTWSRQDNMPTAQFYRVTVDNLFPYNIYGGQQDNSSVKIASQEIGSRSIGQRSWTYAAGGESAFLAFNPDDPKMVLGGSYLGTIEALNMDAKAGTNIMAAPIQYLGRAASDMKYRFNWNAPIIKSQHEPNTFYHAAQLVLRTRDLGTTWEEASPDLSKNDKAKQIKGGGPYTVEAVGAENYGTISNMMESPHEKGVIWVTTDDGLVQLTRDNCESWQNVTPRGLKECLVNSVDVSPHDPATAYIATTRYKFNDHTPALYKTNDYGKTWTNITKGIPDGAFTRVVREDDVVKGLLYAGTETGVYVSFDDGGNWHSLQLNLPVCPITDLIVRHGDLVVATSGRSFWILDDLGAIRQYAGGSATFKLFRPEDAILMNGGSPLNGNSPSFKGTDPFKGVNPATGVVIYYHLPEDGKKMPIALEIKNGAGEVIRNLSSAKDSTYRRWDGGPPPEPTISNKIGLNRFVWNMRLATMPGVSDTYIEGSYRGHKVAPGNYTLTLKRGDESLSTDFKILPNPLYPTDAETYQAYDKLMSEMEATLTDMHHQINTLHDIQMQLRKIRKRLPKGEKYNVLKADCKTLIDEIMNWDEAMVQRKSKAYDDVENFENKLTANYLFVINQAESDIPKVTQPVLDRKEVLEAEWAPMKQKAANLINTIIPGFNQKLWNVGIGAVVPKK
ncbi:MAG: glycosyl hydrolase [Bacteroidota bacterium]